ncbi:hypothetical protein VTH8203_02923 [Vibrio thalassae]|uniref:Uncharacterized protein n=1 Tax=Vibrio thalassae TaxID=1243014 RepID=A0A240EKZ5_9VIBR|nr:hypothetical protein [Vibrio thalassae]SNX49276.1 hypothetical protein VTH8203_02923 [Vibrio thalassae]
MLSTPDYDQYKDDSKNWLIHIPEELDDTIYDLPHPILVIETQSVRER